MKNNKLGFTPLETNHQTPLETQSRFLTGFTLVEMMIVVGIILVILAIAVPAMIRGKMTGNEANAIAAVRTIGNAYNLYLFQTNNFPPDLNTLTQASPPYISSSIANANASNPKDGYYYTYTLVGNTGFQVIARPSRWQVTGNRCFSTDETGKVLYCNTEANCNPDQPL